MANERKSRRADGAAENKPTAKKAAARPSHARAGMLDLDSEQTARLLIFGAVGLVMAIAAGFLIFGYWYSVIRPRNRTVLHVADQTVSYEAMKRRMSYEFLQNPSYQTPQASQILPALAFQAVLDDLTKITQAGPRLGVTVDQSEADANLRAKLSLSQSADQRQFADALRKALETTGFTESEYRSIVLAEAISTKIVAKFTADAPATALQAKIALITTQTADEAKQAVARVNAGEDFSAVAKAVSKETDVQTTGGVKVYSTKESLNALYRDFAFSADIGSVSAPIAPATSAGVQTSSAQYYVVKVIDRSDQPLTDAQKGQIAAQQGADWLKTTQDEMRADGTLKVAWDDKSQADALQAIGPGVGAKLAAQQRQKQQDQQRATDARATKIAELTSTPQVSSTPSADSTPTPVATAAAQDQGGSPVAPSQPVAPGGNGQ